MNLYSMKSLVLTGLLATSFFGHAQNQPVLERKTIEIIQKGKFQFKDLNKNKKLDRYEDLRLPIQERVKDLVSQMTLEEKIGFMLISTTRMGGDQVFAQGVQPGGPASKITDGFNEEDLVQSTNMFTRKPLPTPNMGAAGTTKGVTQYNLRHFILRANAAPDIMARWSNNLPPCEIWL